MPPRGEVTPAVLAGMPLPDHDDDVSKHDRGSVFVVGGSRETPGAILAMLVDTMIPEATEATHDYSGLIAVMGFLAAFVLSKLGG